jgi:ATP-binding cassette subfamily C protein LapB
LAPLGNIAMTIARAQQAMQAMGGISQFVRLPVDRNSLVQDGREIEQASVVFDQVDFTYPNATREAIKDISFSASPGERIGIVGRVGSGKSTIGRLMAGLYQPQRGSILLGGAEIRSYEIAEVRGAVSLVLQEPELFSGTLRDNISIGKPGASEAEIGYAARIAGVDRFAASNPLGMQMPIGEGGRHLSGGQRQAVSLARAILRQPKIVFLDEPSSAMDTTTENELIAQLDVWAGSELTLFVCTHRMSFLTLVDRLIVIENGRIVADGPRDEVLASLQSNNAQSPG